MIPSLLQIMEEKRTKILCSGLLFKSPVKHQMKASIPLCWKLRWCVLALISHIRSASENLKLVFCYYKNEESFRNEELPLGVLTIDQDSKIRPCYESQAGYNHLFSIKCGKKKFVKLSPPSCKVKSAWIRTISSFLRKPQAFGSRRHSSYERRQSSDSGVKSRANSQGSIDSGSFPLKIHGSKPSADRAGISIPEDYAPVCRLSRTRSMVERAISLFRGRDKENETENGGDADGEEVEREDDMEERRLFSDIFSLCEACNGSQSKKKPKLRGSSLSKKESPRKHASKSIETKQSLIEDTSSSCSSLILSSTSSFSGASFASTDSAFPEDECHSNSGDRTYSEIDEIWLMKVRDIMAKTEKIEKSQDLGDDDDDDADKDDEEYVDMSVVQEQVKRLMHDQSEQSSVVRANIHNTTGHEKVVFQMNI